MIQLQIIEKSMAAEVRSVHEYLSKSEEDSECGKEKQPLLAREDLLNEAEAIYAEIMENRFMAKNGDYSGWRSSMTWPGPNQPEHHGSLPVRRDNLASPYLPRPYSPYKEGGLL
jgi:hypothetical protein